MIKDGTNAMKKLLTPFFFPNLLIHHGIATNNSKAMTTKTAKYFLEKINISGVSDPCEANPAKIIAAKM